MAHVLDTRLQVLDNQSAFPAKREDYLRCFNRNVARYTADILLKVSPAENPETTRNVKSA